MRFSWGQEFSAGASARADLPATLAAGRNGLPVEPAVPCVASPWRDAGLEALPAGPKA